LPLSGGQQDEPEITGRTVNDSFFQLLFSHVLAVWGGGTGTWPETLGLC